MSKQLDKFKAKFSKFQKKNKDLNQKNARMHVKNVGKHYQGAKFNAEGYFIEALVKVRKRGVKAEKLNVVMKEPEVKDAMKVFNTTVNRMATELANHDAFVKRCTTAGMELRKFKNDIDKDLRKRKDSSASKKDIDKLSQEVDKTMDNLSKSAGITVPKVQRAYPDNFQKTLTKLVAMAPDAAEAKSDSVLLPQMLVDRNMKKAKGTAMRLHKEMKALCDEAEAKVKSDMKAAITAIKATSKPLKQMKSLSDDYTKAIKVAKGDLEKSKDKKVILKDVDQINKLFKSSATQVKKSLAIVKKG